MATPAARATARRLPALEAWVQHAVVLLVITIAAGSLYRQFLPDAPFLWYSAVHDRNGHYGRSQNVALALHRGSLRGLIREISSATVWPPLHPFVTGPALAVGGLDYRVAVLSSLAAWGASCWLAFALARRLAPNHPGVAGGAALLFTLASPAYRAYATDIMIESLGAALTLATLYLYVTGRQDGSAWRWRGFALFLLALFLTKYNYWTLLVTGLLLGALVEFHRPLAAMLRAWWQSWDIRSAFAAQLRHPLTYLLVPVFGFALYVTITGRVPLAFAGHTVPLGASGWAQLAYALVLLRLLPWWWRRGRHAVGQLPLPGRQFVYWNVYPQALWFLLPKRLSVFLWYVTSTQHGRKGAFSPAAGSFSYYWQCLVADYHAHSASLAVALALIALALLWGHPRPPGALEVLVFLAVASVLTNYHTANRCRFLHSWAAVGWVVAGVGAAQAVERLGRASPAAWLRGRVPAFVTLAALATLQGPALGHSGHAEEGGVRVTRPSFLALADTVGRELASAHRPVLISNEPFQYLLEWRLREAGAFDRRLLTLPDELLSPTSPAALDAWLQANSCDAVLVIDSLRPEAPRVRGFDADHLRTLLASSGTFVLTSDLRFEMDPPVTIRVWRAGRPSRSWLPSSGRPDSGRDPR